MSFNLQALRSWRDNVYPLELCSVPLSAPQVYIDWHRSALHGLTGGSYPFIRPETAPRQARPRTEDREKQRAGREQVGLWPGGPQA